MFTIALACATILIAACDKSGKSAPSPPAPAAAAPSLPQLIIGRWYLTASSGEREFMDFDANGKLVVSNSDDGPITNAALNALGKIYCTYSLSGETLIIEITGADSRAVALFRTGQISRIQVTVESPDSLLLSETLNVVDHDPVIRYQRLR
jgi:hypothetical protein